MANDSFKMYENMIKQSYKFNEWAGKTIPYEGKLCNRFVVDRDKLIGYVFEGKKYLSEDMSSFKEYYNVANNKNVRILLTVYECKSVMNAHELLLNLLSKCTAPALPKIDEKGINAGDIGFGGHGELQTGVFFCRFNMVILVDSIGEEELSVKDFAENIDQQIIVFQKAGDIK